MTDMKISDGAVEAAARAACCFGQDCYEEQEVRDAVREMGND